MSTMEFLNVDACQVGKLHPVWKNTVSQLDILKATVKAQLLRGGPLDIQGGARFFPPCANILFLPASNGKLFFSKDTYNQTFFFWRPIKSNILFFITNHML